jgi:acetylornithine deacetylase
VFAAEVLAKLGVQLRGDLLVNTVTDEESSGAGGIASVTHGVRADAAIVPEPTGFDVWVACRGTVTPTISILGRPGHAETTQPHWREGGAVNPIEKMPVILEALQQLRSAWRARADHRHPYLSPGDLVPTLIRGGEWPVTHPASCSLTVDVTYLPHQADERGWGTRIEQELLEAIGRAALTDPWLAENPPVVEWSLDIPPAEVSPEEPIVGLLLAIARELGIASAISGFDSWHDGATFTRLCGIPAVAFGPTGLKTGGPQIGHTVDEYVPVQDLVQCAQALALAAIRFCRVAEMA